MNTEENKEEGKKNKNEEELTSKDVENAHAVGDGASGRSKETITEDDLHPIKVKNKPKPGSAESY